MMIHLKISFPLFFSLHYSDAAVETGSTVITTSKFLHILVIENKVCPLTTAPLASSIQFPYESNSPVLKIFNLSQQKQHNSEK